MVVGGGVREEKTKIKKGEGGGGRDTHGYICTGEVRRCQGRDGRHFALSVSPSYGGLREALLTSIEAGRPPPLLLFSSPRLQNRRKAHALQTALESTRSTVQTVKLMGGTAIGREQGT